MLPQTDCPEGALAELLVEEDGVVVDFLLLHQTENIILIMKVGVIILLRIIG